MSGESGSIQGAECHDCHMGDMPYLTDPSCGLCMEPMRKARCVPINYVQKVCAIVPQNYYVPSPYKMDDGTTYKGDFTPKPYGKTSPFVPGRKHLLSSYPFEGLSEYNYSYLPYQVAPYAKPPWAKLGEYKGTEGTLNGVSTYKSAFQPLCGSPAKLLRPRAYKNPDPGPFDDLSTYKMQFVAYDSERVCSLKPEVRVSGTCIQPFHGNTMYTSSYLPPCTSQRAMSYKPRPRFRSLDYPFEDDTTYTGAYRPFAFQHCTPVIKRNCYAFKDLKL